MLIKKRPNSNLNADRSDFLAKQTEACLRILYVKYYSDKLAFKTKLQNCFLLLEGLCHFTELEPAEILNAKTSTSLLKRGDSNKNEKFFCKTYLTLIFFFRIEGIISKTFLKKTISIVGIHLYYLGGCVR